MDNLSFASKGININNGKADEVATPIQICNDMIDLFPKEDFSNPRKIWADLYCKTGNTLMALKRYGVPKENIIAICTTPQSQLFACRQLYGKLLEEVEIDLKKYPEVTGTFTITKRRNVYYISNWKNIVLGKVSNTNAFEIINKIILKETRSEIQLEWDSDKEFTINNIIMNPPYNKGMDLDFVNLAFKIATDNVVAITPAKWQTAEADHKVVSNMSYGEFRKQLVPHMSHVVFYPDALDVFGIGIREGITWFKIDKQIHEKCQIVNKCKLQKYFNTEETRCITNGETLHNIGAEIISYLGNYKKFKFSTVTEKKKYSVWSMNDITIGGRSGSEYFLLSSTGQSVYVGASKIIEQGDISDTPNASVLTFESNDITECQSFVSWLNTKFTRFFVAVNLSNRSGVMDNHYFRFVPAPPSGKFDHIYTDQELYEAFNLPQKYIDVIEAVIKERK